MELFVAVLTALVNFILGLVTYFKNPKSASNKLIAFLAFQIGIWAIINYVSLNATTELATLWWIRIDMLPGAPMGPTIYLLARTFPESKINAPKWMILGLAILIIGTMLLALSPHMFTSVVFENGNIKAIPGPAIVVFALNFVGCLALSFVTLIKRFRTSTGLVRAQLKYLLFGLIATFTLIATTDFLVVILFHSSFFVPLGPAYTLILIASISYAIVKHRFLDISLVIARTVSYAVLIALLAVFYALLFGVSTALLVPVSSDIRTVGVSTILALIMAMTFQPIRSRVEQMTDKFFYKNQYDAKQLLYDLTFIMASNLELELLGQKLLKTLLSQMRIGNGVFILTKNEKIYEVISEGQWLKTAYTDEEIKPILSQDLLLFEELEESPTKDLMRKLGFVVAIQLKVESETIGFLALGEKHSGDVYSKEDLKVLEIIAPEAAVAVQNAKAYVEIKRFNATLQQKVDKATEELQKANDRLFELDKLKSEFVSVASHELRTPMTAIKSYLWMAIAGRGGNITDKQKYYLERAYMSTDRLIKLVNDLLNVSRIESGKLAVDMQKMAVPQFVNEVIAEVKPKADELGIKILNEAGKLNLPEVLADPDKIKEVLINFLGNSLKFSKQGGEIRIWCENLPGFVEICVTDSGEGIEAADLPKLFQKFGLVKGSYVTNQNASQGTGLGLYISKSIVELHGGTIKATSPGRGKGATFSFTLPVYSEEALEEAQKHKGTEGLGIIHSTLD